MLFSAVLFSALASLASAQLTIATPAALTVCRPTKLTWSEGTGPYYLSVIPGGNQAAPPLLNLADGKTIDGNSYTWMVNLPAGTSVNVKITDSTGADQFTSPVTIQDSSDKSCLNASSSSAGPAASSTDAPAGTSVASSSEAPATTGSTTKAPVNGGADTTASSSSSSAASKTSSTAGSSSAAPSPTKAPSAANMNAVAIPAVAAAVAGALLF